VLQTKVYPYSNRKIWQCHWLRTLFVPLPKTWWTANSLGVLHNDD
jgi:hypothetical protein